MRRITILISALVISSVSAFAQRGSQEVKGSLYDFNSAEPLYPAAVQIFALPDTTYINGTSTEEDGSFVVSGVAAGQYVLRASFMGYENTEKTFTVRAGQKTTDLGRLTMKADAIALKAVDVTAQVAKVQMVNDTVMFNGAAYKLPEGSTVEDLVRKLPGVQINSSGGITVNGKTVSRILVNGKEFFNGDNSVALNNLTADMVDRIKAYDKQSDLARMTGIDDGNEETVLDLTVKRNMMHGWVGMVGAGYGRPMQETIYDIDNLYNTNITLNKFADDRNFTVTGQIGNARGGGVGGFGGGRGMGGGGGVGTSTNGNIGVNFARNIGKEVSNDSYEHEIGGSIRYSYGSSESQSKSNSENFYTGGTTTFGNTEGMNGSHNQSVNGQLRYERNFNEMTSFVFTPSLSYSWSDNWSKNRNATFTRDPYEFASNPLDASTAFDSGDPLVNFLDSLNDAMRNSQNSISKGESTSIQTSGNFQFVHKLNNQGRNVSARINYSYSDGNSKSYSRNDQTANHIATTLNRYSETPNSSINLSSQVSYTEPIARATYLSVTYEFSYRRSDSDRATYDLGQAYASPWGTPWDTPEWVLEDNYELYKSNTLSRLSQYDNMDHTIQAQVRRTTDNYNMTAGFALLPQYSAMIEDYMGTHTDMDRWVFNWTPTLNFRYRWTRQEQMEMSYRGRSSQPSMQQLSGVRDNSNPLAISSGNPDLKPTFSNTFNASYRKYNPVTLGSIQVGAGFNNTLRTIQNKTTLDALTFGTETMPVNMEGFWANWSTNGNLNLERAFGEFQRVNIGANTQVSFSHSEGWASIAGQDAQLRTSLTTSVSPRLSAEYRGDWFEIDLQGNLRYNHSTNDLQPDRNMDTYDFNYGPSLMVMIPWHNARITTDGQMVSRRGYSGDMNTDEFLWNAQFQFSFLKQNKGTLSLSVYDILQQRSTVTRSMSPTSRRDTYNNNINSYFMLSFSYRIQAIGDRDTRQNMRNMGRSMMGGGMGGFGGGMPMGGGFGGGMGGGMRF